ncbi:MAG TPA: hypothetical protein VF830_06870 [Gemmatimonadales bacterium]
MRHEARRTDQASRLYEEARDELFSHLLKSRIADAEPARRRAWLTETLAYLEIRYPRLPSTRFRHLEEAAERLLRTQMARPA